MQNEMRDRLIEILLQKTCHYSDIPCDNECGVCGKIELYRTDIESIADHLIENGVIAPPCKAGQTVYCLIEGFNFVSEGRVRSITIYDNCIAVEIAVYGYYAQRCTNKDFGHSVFLTKEDAEQKLKGGAKE